MDNDRCCQKHVCYLVMDVNEASGSNDTTTRKWRKKKKSFLTKAKRNEKQDRCGRGAAIPQDTYSYLLASFEILKKGFEDKENRR